MEEYLSLSTISNILNAISIPNYRITFRETRVIEPHIHKQFGIYVYNIKKYTENLNKEYQRIGEHILPIPTIDYELTALLDATIIKTEIRYTYTNTIQEKEYINILFYNFMKHILTDLTSILEKAFLIKE